MVTTLLVLVNIFNSVLVSTPSEPGRLTALALWIVACIGFVFLSLLSYIFILVRLRWLKTDSADGGYQPPCDNQKKLKVNIDLVMLGINVVTFLGFSTIYILHIYIME